MKENSDMTRSGYQRSMKLIVGLILAIGLGAIGSSCGGIDGPPPPPGSFMLTSPTNTTTPGAGLHPTLVWTDATGETSYTIQISTSPTFTINTFSDLLSANTISYMVNWPTVTTGGQYYWQVLATNNLGVTKAANAPFTFVP
jgi:trimeric autotransporter adhesin